MANRLEQVRLYSLMLRHWAGMVRSDSYWHAPQGLGPQFVPGKLRGYFNDLTRKVDWSGPVDTEGLILNRLPSGQLVYFPTAVFQQALGHWDLWLASEGASVEHRNGFLASARWAVRHQDEFGGWTAWSQLGLHYDSPYSGLTQGEGISLLVRAWMTTGDESFVEHARKAVDLLNTPVERGGLMREVREGLVLEEISNAQATTILNGWVFGLFGLYDYLLVRHDEVVARLMEGNLDALRDWLPRFDAGYWSFYDTGGSLASPFYHRLHIAQLSALEKTFPDHSAVFAFMRGRFEQQHSSRLRRGRAVVHKMVQKLRNPPDTVLR